MPTPPSGGHERHIELNLETLRRDTTIVQEPRPIAWSEAQHLNQPEPSARWSGRWRLHCSANGRP
jgi:hypothetical protein